MIRPKKDHTLLKILAVFAIAIVVVFGIFKLLGSRGTTPAPEPGAPSAPPPNLARAHELFAEGKLAEAREALQPLVDSHDADSEPEALLLLARVQRASGNTAEAAKAAEKAYKDFPASPQRPLAALAYALSLEDTGDVAGAVKIYEEVRDSAPPEMRAGAFNALGRLAEKKNDILSARELYRKAVNDAAWDSDAWNDALDGLGRVNTSLIFASAATPESKIYSVQKGDSITGIGNSLNTTQSLLTRANGIAESARLSLGQQLKYTPKDFRIVIERSKSRLFLVDKDGIFKRYSVGLGKPGHETTLGSFKIGNKEKDPVWHKPGAGAIPAGDPQNELGTRWMPLVPDQQGLPKDLGIHGTIRPETVGKYTSNGCARLLPGEIEELYDLVVRATPVDIVETCTKDMIGESSK